jgi:Immunity protein 10
MMRFKAMAVCATEMPDLDCFVVILAERSDGSGARLEAQRAFLFDEQDQRLGQDTYCLCTEWGAVCYGGVVSWSIAENELKIILDARAATVLGVSNGFLIELEVDSNTLDQLNQGLRRVLDAVTTSQP